MDFQQLLSKMQELDTPAIEGDCGMPPPSPMNTVPPVPDTPPPSMSVNINAQGLDNIEDMMRLFQKVNPDMMPIDKPSMPPMPALSVPPSIMSIKPELPPLKMLPDMDADNDDMPGGEMDSDYDRDGKLDPHEKDHADEKPLLKSLDKDNDGDHDMDDHDAEKKKEEEYANEPSEKEIALDTIYSGNDLHKEKKTYPKVAGADNPMQRTESLDLKSQIRQELLKRLAEAKGVK